MRLNKNAIRPWVLPVGMLIAAIVGLLASFVLTYDKLHLLQNPAYQPGCNLNPVLSCGSVMETAQASIFGVPNTLFGLMAFTALGVVALLALTGTTFKRWFWLLMQLAATAGIVFVHYLIFEAVFRIHAICPWCFAVWLVTFPVFFGITLHNMRRNYFGVPRHRFLIAICDWIDRHAVDLFVLWYVALFTLLLVRFWYYWQTLL